MKKAGLCGAALVALCFPALLWVMTLVPGLPRGVYLYEAGRVFALLAFVLIFLQFVWASRIKTIEKGIGRDTLFRVHRFFGFIALTLALAHPVCILLSERIQGYASPLNLLKVFGVATLFLLIASVFVAGFYQRLPITYETRKRIHAVGFALFPLAFAHSFLLGSGTQKWPLRVFWLILAAGYVAVVAHKVVTGILLRRRAYTVSEVRRETHDTWTLAFEGMRRNYLPGQFMILHMRGNDRVEAHPFTIASSPNQATLAITVKAVGDFTSFLSRIKTPSTALIDMPYGTFSLLNHPAEAFVFIAGGIGITPFMSMLRFAREEGAGRPILLLWSNKHERDIVFKKELEDIEQALPTLKVVHILSREHDWPGEKGHIDAERLKKYLKNFTIPRFFLCGPVPMMRSVKGTLRGLGVPRNRIHLERFSL